MLPYTEFIIDFSLSPLTGKSIIMDKSPPFLGPELEDPVLSQGAHALV